MHTKLRQDLISQLGLAIREKKQNLRRLEAESNGSEFTKQTVEWVGRGLASHRKGLYTLYLFSLWPVFFYLFDFLFFSLLEFAHN